MKAPSLVPVVIALAAAGCLPANRYETLGGLDARAVLGDDGHLAGGGVRGTAGFGGVIADVELAQRDTVRAGDPARHRAVGLGLSVRGSLFGLVSDSHELERYFDVGAEVGGGLGVVLGVPGEGAVGTQAGWVGAWTEVGTVSIGRAYLAVTGAIRREAFQAPWGDRTELFVGLAWRHRALGIAEQR
jgi:hypothetical protein